VLVLSHRVEKVNVAVPLALAKVAMRFLPKGLRVKVDGDEVDLERLLEEVQTSGAQGTLVDVRSPNGDSVQIVVE
jgi:hypothetical protein